jgi:hypothetical protein
MTNPGNKGEFDRLKAELQRLKRAQAPWYFESSLHQRLHGGRRPRVRHAPFRFGFTITVSFFSLAVIALAVYLVFLNSTLFQPGVPLKNSVSVPIDSTSIRPPGGTPVQENPLTHAPPAIKIARPEAGEKDLPRLAKPEAAESVNVASDSDVTVEKPASLPKGDQRVTPVDTTRGGPVTGRGGQTPRSRPDSSAAAKPAGRFVPDSANTGPRTP